MTAVPPPAGGRPGVPAPPPKVRSTALAVIGFVIGGAVLLASLAALAGLFRRIILWGWS